MKIILISLLIGISSLIGIIIGHYLKENKRFIKVIFGIVLSIMILLIFLEMPFDAYDLLIKKAKGLSSILFVIAVLIGYLILKLIDSFIPEHEFKCSSSNQHKTKKNNYKHLEHVGIMISITIISYNIIKCMSLHLISNQLESVITGIYNFLLGIMIGSTIYEKRKRILLSISVIFSSLVGSLLMLFSISNIFIGVFIAITLGMLVYTCLMELIPQFIYNNDKKDTLLGIVLGCVIFFISMVLR